MRIPIALFILALAVPGASRAQEPPASEAQQAPPQVDPRDAADRRPSALEPDFVTVNLPTTLRLPRYRSAFRISHRFTRTLNNPSFGDLASNLFGLDGGAFIGFEYRFGLMRGLQAGIYRTSDKTIQFFGQYDLARQSEALPATINIVASVEGLNNFHKGNVVDPEDNEYTTAVGVILARTVGNRAAFYLQPSYIFHANTYSTEGCMEHIEHGHDIPGCAELETAGIESNTLMIGVSSRLRLTPTVYVVGSWTPRGTGFGPGTSMKTFALEKRLGGHTFQLNVSNSLGTTMAQMARGAQNSSDWFLGFNISRKFY